MESKLERVLINRMPIAGQKLLSAYSLSETVGKLNFIKPSLRYPARLDGKKKSVLRALCDRYPNVFPSLADIAMKASCSPAQARRILRELEYKDRLIVDINSRLHWSRGDDGRWILNSDSAGKKGGVGKNGFGGEHTPQYFICDRKILAAC